LTSDLEITLLAECPLEWGKIKYIERKYFEESRYLSSKFVDFGFDWEVHPAYRWALQPDNLSDVFTQMKVSAE
jgi:hypothetical protein